MDFHAKFAGSQSGKLSQVCTTNMEKWLWMGQSN